MRIMVDTNVIMDILQRREPFFTDSYQAVHSIIKEDGECMLSASAATDIFYMLRKALQSPQQAMGAAWRNWHSWSPLRMWPGWISIPHSPDQCLTLRMLW